MFREAARHFLIGVVLLGLLAACHRSEIQADIGFKDSRENRKRLADELRPALAGTGVDDIEAIYASDPGTVSLRLTPPAQSREQVERVIARLRMQTLVTGKRDRLTVGSREKGNAAATLMIHWGGASPYWDASEVFMSPRPCIYLVPLEAVLPDDVVRGFESEFPSKDRLQEIKAANHERLMTTLRDLTQGDSLQMTFSDSQVNLPEAWLQLHRGAPYLAMPVGEFGYEQGDMAVVSGVVYDWTDQTRKCVDKWRERYPLLVQKQQAQPANPLAHAIRNLRVHRLWSPPR
nr:hypothetical protein [Pseudoxanthomonas sp.]